MGGGNSFLTQSYPTNFHTFFTRKILAKNENIEDYKEVTASERTAIEKADAAWVEPSAGFIEQWNLECGKFGQYNPQTGFFELNGLTDITLEQAKTILRAGAIWTFDASNFYAGTNIRTNLPLKAASDSANLQKMERLIYMANKLEVLNLTIDRDWGAYWEVFAKNPERFYCIQNASSLREVIGIIGVEYITASGSKFFVYQCPNLERIYLYGIKVNWDIPDIAKLDSTSVRYMVTARQGTNEITIRVHPDVYAKLTDETNEEWHQILLYAAEKKVIFST